MSDQAHTPVPSMQTALAPPTSVPFTLRPAAESDTGFIAQSWVREFRCSSRRLKHLDSHLFNQYCYPRVRRWLENSTITMACQPSNPEVVYGYVVYSYELMHMVYVLSAMRRMGIAKALLGGVDLSSKAWTTTTESYETWLRHKEKYRCRRGHFPFWMIEVDSGTSAGSDGQD